MPLQIRRGNTVQRLTITPLPGELIYDTDLSTIFVGDGTNPGGVSAITGITAEDARDAVGQMFANGIHQNINFTYGLTQDAANRIDAAVDLSNYQGEISAAAFTGSLFADDSSLLVDAVNGSINLDGTIKGNLIPDANEIYDIGSASNRFKDLYLSGTSLFLGSAQITASGSAIELPAGSTVAGIPIGIGTGGDGLSEGSNYKINIIADNSSVLVNSDTGEFFGNLTGDVLGNLTGDVLGNVTGDVLGNVTGNVTGDILGNLTGDILGNVTGNVTGSVTGDVLGSVFADDSTIMVDATNKIFQGNLIGDVAASTISTQFLDGDSSSTVIVRTALNVQSDLVVENDFIASGDVRVLGELDVDNRIIGTSGFLYIESPTNLTYSLQIDNERDTNDTILNVVKHNDNNLAARVALDRSRGSKISPTQVQNNDTISSLVSRGWDGSFYTTSTAITTSVEGATSAGIVPGRISFSTMNSTGQFAERARFNSNGNLELFLPPILVRNAITNDFFFLQQFHNSPNESSNILFTRARGINTAPSAVNANDAIIDLAAAAFDGSTYIGSSTIRMNVDGAVSSGIVPGRIEFWTADSLGNQTKKAQFNRDGILEVDRIRPLNSSLSIVGDLIGSVFSDSSTMVIDGTDGSVKYYPTTPADWAGTPPTTVGEAIDRLAARLKLIDGGVGA